MEYSIADDQRLARPKSHILNWISAIRGEEKTIAPAEVGHRTASVCQLAAIGYEVGVPLNWNPETEKFVGDHADLANPLRDRTRRPNWREDDLSNS